MPQQVSDPLCILHVGLAARHRSHVPRVGDQQLELAALEQVEYRAPVDAGRLHRYVSHAQRREPICHAHQLSRHRPERPHLLVLGCDYARHHRLLVHVEPSTSFVHDLHRHHLLLVVGWSGMVAAWIKTFLFVLTREVRPHYVVPVSNQPQVIFRALGTKGSSRVFPDQTRALHTTWRGGLEAPRMGGYLVTPKAHVWPTGVCTHGPLLLPSTRGLPFAVSSRITLTLGSSPPPTCNSAQSPGVVSRHEDYEYNHTNSKEEVAAQRRVG